MSEIWLQTPAERTAPARQPAKVYTTARQATGERRLRDLPRDVQRPLESRLYHLRTVHHLTDEEISRKLDLHIDDLPALAATAGQV